MRKLYRRIMCKFGHHRRYDVIQTFGDAQHIGCPDCGREFGIHHTVRAIIPWTSDMAAMYRLFGHDVDTPAKRWRAYIAEPPHEAH